jgi:hypothetical protein
MSHTKSGFIPDLRIWEFVDQSRSTFARFDWMFVCIDAIRGTTLRKVEARVEEILGRPKTVESFVGTGVWISGHDLWTVDNKLNLFVPYTAAYLFPIGVVPAGPAPYDCTSASGSFDEHVPDSLESYVRENGAAGFMADGDGFNYHFRDHNLIALVDEIAREEIKGDGS